MNAANVEHKRSVNEAHPEMEDDKENAVDN